MAAGARLPGPAPGRSAGDADGLLDRVRLAERTQHVVGDVGARNRQAAPQVLAVGGAVAAGQGLAGQPGRPDHGPVQAAAGQDVLHLREVGEHLAERRAGDVTEQVPHEEPVARVVLGRVRARGRGYRAHRGGADRDDAPDAGGLHRRHDDPRALRRDPGVGIRPGAEAGQDRIGPADRRLHRRRVGGGQVGGDGPDRPGKLARIADHRGHVVARLDGLLKQLPADAAGRREDRELHLVLLA